MANATSRWGVVLLGAAVAIGSAGALRAQTPAPASGDPMDAKTKMFLTQCRAEFAQVDARIDKAGTRFAEYRLVPGFPYMRSDRLLASYSDQVDNSDVFDAWTLELRDNDGFSREIELANMGMPKQQRAVLLNDLRLCAVWLSNIELVDKATLAKLVEAAKLPDRAERDAAATAKLDSETARRQALVKADFDRPLAQLDSPGSLVQWQVKRVADTTAMPTDWQHVNRDGLGRTGLTPDSWRALAEQNAPRWLIETAGAYDAIGEPVLTKQGVHVDPAHPVVYFQAGYARVNGHAQIQMSYFMWFSERHASGAGDPDAGNVDGLIWRVTLDSEGRPQLYDSIHMSGMDQAWYVPQTVVAKPQSPGEDPVLVAQHVEAVEAPVVRLHTGSHTPRRILAASEAPSGPVKSYELREYEELMTMPSDDKGDTRALFDAHGLVPGTERADNPLYRSIGIPGPGAMRLWGMHPTALSARHYFDDPNLIDTLFVVAGRGNSASSERLELASGRRP